MAGHAKAKAERCPSWRQLYRITATLCEAAGIDAPTSAQAASDLIDRLDALGRAVPAEPETVTVHTGDDCPF